MDAFSPIGYVTLFYIHLRPFRLACTACACFHIVGVGWFIVFVRDGLQGLAPGVHGVFDLILQNSVNQLPGSFLFRRKFSKNVSDFILRHESYLLKEDAAMQQENRALFILASCTCAMCICCYTLQMHKMKLVKIPNVSKTNRN